MIPVGAFISLTYNKWIRSSEDLSDDVDFFVLSLRAHSTMHRTPVSK